MTIMNPVTASRYYKYMYEFCTMYCKPNDCPEDVSCLNAHSKRMIRRIPKQDPYLGRLFNYIPKQYLQYKKSKKCSFGYKSFLAHGQLEIIFHPLLYKTKLCLSKLENGILLQVWHLLHKGSQTQRVPELGSDL